MTLDILTCPQDLDAIKQLADSGIALEVGSWQGESAKALIAGGMDQVHCVDTWQGGTDPADMTSGIYAARGGDQIFRDFCANVGPFLFNRIWPHRMTSALAASIWPFPLDLVFIDGDHTYEMVQANIREWLPHIRPGGIICGHDYDKAWPGVIRAVDEAFQGKHRVSGHSVWWWRKS